MEQVTAFSSGSRLIVEFLLYAGRLESAERVVQEVRREAEEKQAELFALRARILSLEVDRRQGKPVHWRGVLANCERRHYSLGVAYVLAMSVVRYFETDGRLT